MKTMELFISSFIDELKQAKIKKVIFSSSVSDSYFIKECVNNDFECFCFEDARSIAYVGTGMAAESKETIVIATNGDNESRSFQPGLTEAFYKNLPIIAIVISDRKKLNNSIQLNDTIKANYYINANYTKDDANKIILNVINGKKPCFLEFDQSFDCDYTEKEIKVFENFNQFHYDSILNCLSDILENNHSLFIGSDIFYNGNIFNCKVSSNSGALGCEGSLANVLGASLANTKDQYIGLVTEKEFIHDINTLGNRCINKKVVYIVITKTKKQMIIDYASSLGFDCVSFEEIHQIIDNNRKKPLIVTVNEEDA